MLACLSRKRDRPSMLPRQVVQFQRGLNPFPHLVSIAFLVLMFPLRDIVYLVSFFVQNYFMMFILLSCRGNSASSICNFESWSIDQSWISGLVCDRGSLLQSISGRSNSLSLSYTMQCNQNSLYLLISFPVIFLPEFSFFFYFVIYWHFVR